MRAFNNRYAVDVSQVQNCLETRQFHLVGWLSLCLTDFVLAVSLSIMCKHLNHPASLLLLYSPVLNFQVLTVASVTLSIPWYSWKIVPSQRTGMDVEFTGVLLLNFSWSLQSYPACGPMPGNSCCICFAQFFSCFWWEGTSYSVKEAEVSYSFETYAFCVFDINL